MATIRIPAENTPVTINKFLGLNSAEESETQLQLGEASEMLNMRITDDFKLETIEGYRNIFEQEENIEDIFNAQLNGEEFLIYRKGSSLYKYLDEEETKISGNFNINKCSYICFNDKIYVLDGNGYYEYDGEIFQEVVGYAPLIAIGTEPAGGGTDFERINLLSNSRHQTFSSDGTSTEFILRENNLASIDTVLKNGEIITSGFTKDTVNGKVVFTTAPAQGVDNIDIYWTVNNYGDRELITHNKYMVLYGSSNDTRIFMYGNSDYKNRYYYSDLGDGISRGDYFPATNFKDEGSSNFAITGLIKHYNRLVVFKENETRYAEYEDLEATDSNGNTVYIPALKSYPLNSTIGNLAMNQVQLLDNFPVCLNAKGLYLYNQTNVRAETNVQYVSQRIQNELDKINVKNALMFDYENKHELWIVSGKQVYVYNYNINVFSKYQLADEPTSFAIFNNKLFFTCNKGIMNFDNKFINFNGELIEQKWESSYYNFGKDYKRKNVNRLYISMKPFYKTNVDINFQQIEEKELKHLTLNKT